MDSRQKWLQMLTCLQYSLCTSCVCECGGKGGGGKGGGGKGGGGKEDRGQKNVVYSTSHNLLN